jgi:hypothetical protein
MMRWETSIGFSFIIRLGFQMITITAFFLLLAACTFMRHANILLPQELLLDEYPG